MPFVTFNNGIKVFNGKSFKEFLQKSFVFFDKMSTLLLNTAMQPFRKFDHKNVQIVEDLHNTLPMATALFFRRNNN